MPNVVEVLQNHVTRNDSINWKINASASALGLGAFFTESIPFDVSTSKHMASQLVSSLLFSAKKTGSKSGVLHVYEFGAGMGILARHFLDILKHEYPDVYKRTLLHVSDISQAKLEELKAGPAFENHHNHVVFDIRDITSPKFEAGQEPVLVYCSYLLDSLPVYHICVQNGYAFEAQVSTHIRGDFRLQSLERGRLYEYDPIKLRALLEHNYDDMSIHLLRRLKPHFYETKKLIPLDETNISENLRHDIRSLIEVNGIVNANLNYSASALSACNEILASMKKGGIFVVIDFGEVRPKENVPSGINQSDYGAYTCHQLDYYILQHYARQKNVHYSVQEESTGSTISAIMSNIPQNDRYTYHFNSVYTRPAVDLYQRIDKELTYLVTEDQLQTFFASTPDFFRTFVFWNSFAYAAAERGILNLAFHCIDQAIKYTNGLAIPPKLLKADLMNKIGRRDEAIATLESIRATTPFCDRVYPKLLELYRDAGRSSSIAALTLDWMSYSEKNDFSPAVFEYTRALTDTGRLRELGRFIGTYPSRVA